MRVFSVLQASVSLAVFMNNALAANIPDAVITVTSTITSQPPPVVTVTVTSGVAPSLGQCGGQQYTGPTRCPNGESCIYVDRNYSRCTRNSELTTTITVITSYNPQPTSAGTSPVWEQCGGSGWTGATRCTSGNECVYRTQYWSQCRPIGYAPPPGKDGIAPVWDQCGGDAWTGATVCESGSECVYQNKYWWQCRPKGYPPP